MKICKKHIDAVIKTKIASDEMDRCTEGLIYCVNRRTVMILHVEFYVQLKHSHVKILISHVMFNLEICIKAS